MATQTASSEGSNVESHNAASSIITAAVVIGFIVLCISGILLFLKITRGLRARRERKRRRDALRRQHGAVEDEKSGRRRKGKGRNAFEDEEWEGVPA
ncbi:hypothetical protein T439DRAFT_322041 [Meredithblackwellia eburnea MCA 4105]